MYETDISITGWRKSRRCESSMCVEVAVHAETGTVFLRDSKLGERSAVLTFSAEEWTAFCDGVRAGDFDPR